MPIIINLDQLKKVRDDISAYIQQHRHDETDSKSASKVSKTLTTISEQLNQFSLLVENLAGFSNVQKNGNEYLIKAPAFEEELHTRINFLLTNLPEIPDIGYESFTFFSNGINQIVTEQEMPQQQETKSPPQIAIEPDDLDGDSASPPADESPKLRR